MNIKTFLLAVAVTTFSYGAEIRVGSGTFTSKFSISNLMGTNFDLDTKTISIANPHDNFSNSKYYFSYDADIFYSEYANKITHMVASPITTNFGSFGSINNQIAKATKLPLPSDYKMAGFDANFGIGYDLAKSDTGYFGVGVVSGFSMPIVKMKNLVKSAKLTYKVLRKTDTTLMTYKVGLGVVAGTKISDNLSLYASAAYGYQTGYIDNDWFKSSFDVDGHYDVFNIGVKYTPFKSKAKVTGVNFNNELYVTAGYTHKDWYATQGKVNLVNVVKAKTFGACKADFSNDQAYVGVGYNF